jgi:hypothetical protein
MPSIHLDIVSPTTLTEVTEGMQPWVNKAVGSLFTSWLGRRYLLLSLPYQPFRQVGGSRCLVNGSVALIIGPLPLEPSGRLGLSAFGPLSAGFTPRAWKAAHRMPLRGEGTAPPPSLLPYSRRASWRTQPPPAEWSRPPARYSTRPFPSAPPRTVHARFPRTLLSSG